MILWEVGEIVENATSVGRGAYYNISENGRKNCGKVGRCGIMRVVV